MWTITGPFDGDISGDVSFSKTKLLKPGKAYILGRKDSALVVNNKKVSREHLVFKVGAYTEEDVANPHKIPTLTVENPTTTSRKHKREGKPDAAIMAEGSVELKHGDVVYAIHNVILTLKWDKVVCYAPEKSYARIPECASIGISMVLTHHADVTHHLTSTYALTASIATSLVSCSNLVQPSWFETLISSSEALEKEFILPQVSKFHPSFSPTLPSSLKNLKAWEPKEERVQMLRDYRIVFVGEKGREAASDMKELAKRAGAAYECCGVQAGNARKNLHNVLAKGKGKGNQGQVVLVADESAIGVALGHSGWNELVEEAASYELKFIAPEKFVQAVVHVDVSCIDCTYHEDDVIPNTVLPDVVLNTIPDEPSAAPCAPPPARLSSPPPPHRRKLVRRAASKPPFHTPSPPMASPKAQSQVEPEPKADSMEAEQVEETSAPRRPLVRRAGKVKTILGLDDPSILDGDSIIVNDDRIQSDDVAEKPVYELPATQASRSRLKRRLGTTQPPLSSQLFPGPTPDEEDEPKYKRFKALFDSTDPDKVAQSGMEEYINMYKEGGGQTMTQAETLAGIVSGARTGRGITGSSLGTRSGRSLIPLLEEEGTQGQSLISGTQTQGTKRKLRMDDEDVEMGDGTQNERNLKRRVCEKDKENAGIFQAGGEKPDPQVETQGTGKTYDKPGSIGNPLATYMGELANGAAPGKPDKDEAFLKAVASTKRGKKHEDEFDREFNNLRISKPELERERQGENYGLLEDFGDDGNIRGNFMVVVELEVPVRERNRGTMVRGEGRAEWESRPNFKKFKKKAQIGERPKPVELFVDDDNEYGISSQLWKGTQLQEDDEPLLIPMSSQKRISQPQRTQRLPNTLMEDSDEELKPKPRSRGRSRATQAKDNTSRGTTPVVTQPPTAQQRKTRARSIQKSQPLFLESDEEPEANTGDNGSDGEVQGMLDWGGTEPGGTLLTATASRKTQDSTTKAKKKLPAIMEDDLDDGATFKGFGRKKRR